MAMPMGGAAANGGGGGGGGNEMQQRGPWVMDERDGFITWLRSEFAAANAIIDAMCHHLRGVGEPGEYEYVVAAVQQRRYNWNPVLNMQQYFPIAEVVFNLQQVAQRRQHRPHEHHHPKFLSDGKEFRKQGMAYRPVHRGDNSRENHVASEKSSEEGLAAAVKKLGISDVDSPKQVENEVVKDTKEAGIKSESNGGVDSSTPRINENQNSSLLPQHFVAHETIDGKSVNVVEGLKLYENLSDSDNISKLFTLANELRAAGRRGEFRDDTYVSLKRPMRGNGREMLQFGPSSGDGPAEAANGAGGSAKDHKVEEVPGLLQDLIKRISQLQIVSLKPDSCIINFFHEGDHSHPFMYPHWYARPVCVLFLNECDMVFGRAFELDNPGRFRGSLNLSLTAGSLLVMQGNSADLSKHAIPSMRKQRILVTFMKRSPKKPGFPDPSRLPLAPQMSATAPPWGPTHNRVSSRAHHPPVTKQYGMIPVSGVLPPPTVRPQHLPTPSGMQPLFVAAPVVSAVPYPAPVTLPPSSGTWQPVPPRHPTPRVPLPGTGVFIPPGGQPTSTSSSSVGETSSTSLVEASEHAEGDKFAESSNGDACVSAPLPEDSLECRKQECNGKLEIREGHSNGQNLETKLVDAV